MFTYNDLCGRVSLAKVAFFIMLCSILIGCQSAQKPPLSNPLPTLKWYVEKYGQIISPEIDEFLNAELMRLLEHDATSANGIAYKIILINSEAPLAFTPGGKYILLSRGLVCMLKNEAELAFIISHEIGHEELGHTAMNTSMLAPSNNDREAMELAADTYALGLVAQAGYDPSAAIGALENAYIRDPEVEYSTSYPDIHQRISKLQALINDAHWLPPGTIDRRDYRKFINSLSHQFH